MQGILPLKRLALCFSSLAKFSSGVCYWFCGRPKVKPQKKKKLQSWSVLCKTLQDLKGPPGHEFCMNVSRSFSLSDADTRRPTLSPVACTYIWTVVERVSIAVIPVQGSIVENPTPWMDWNVDPCIGRRINLSDERKKKAATSFWAHPSVYLCWNTNRNHKG